MRQWEEQAPLVDALILMSPGQFGRHRFEDSNELRIPPVLPSLFSPGDRKFPDPVSSVFHQDQGTGSQCLVALREHSSEAQIHGICSLVGKSKKDNASPRFSPVVCCSAGSIRQDRVALDRAPRRTVKYASISLADACLIRCAEVHREARILTFDFDFKVYRWGRNKRFEIL